MKIEFLPPARAELTDAISYYNIQSEGLGYEFAAEVKKTLENENFGLPIPLWIILIRKSSKGVHSPI